MKHFLKENKVLIAGIMLPILLTMLFFIATQLNNAHHELPRHRVIFIDQSSYNTNSSPYQFVVKNNQLYFSYTDSDKKHYKEKPRLYVFDAQTSTTQEIELPIIKELNTKTDILIPYFAEKSINGLLKSPDGYTFTSDYHNNANILISVFGGGNQSRHRATLSRASSTIIIPDFTRYNVHFIGWVIDEHSAADEE